MKKTEITDTIQHKEQLSSTYLSSFAYLTDLCRKVPAVQYLLEEWHTEYNSDPERTPNHSSYEPFVKCAGEVVWMSSIVEQRE